MPERVKGKFERRLLAMISYIGYVVGFAGHGVHPMSQGVTSISSRHCSPALPPSAMSFISSKLAGRVKDLDGRYLPERSPGIGIDGL